jgi:DNA-binding FadR family transcriptional regulator
LLTRTDQPERDEYAERLRVLIDDGGYAPGDKIPAERQLIDMLGISRAGLRRALGFMERDGVIWRHVGKGTFVSHGAREAAAHDALAGIGNQLSPYRMMRARICIEPVIAREAALYASREHVSRIIAAAKRSQSAASWSENERQEDHFHRCIAEAAYNDLLLALFDSLNRVRREVAWGSVTRSNSRLPREHSSFAEHDAIHQAIEAHDAEAAFHAMRTHLQSVSSRLFEDG